MGNSQDSLTDQLIRVVALAEEAGEYDAADWLKDQLANSEHYSFDPMNVPKEWF